MGLLEIFSCTSTIYSYMRLTTTVTVTAIQIYIIYKLSAKTHNHNNYLNWYGFSDYCVQITTIILQLCAWHVPHAVQYSIPCTSHIQLTDGLPLQGLPPSINCKGTGLIYGCCHAPYRTALYYNNYSEP